MKYISQTLIMNCKLCLEVNENSFELDSVESVQHNTVSILQQYFPFLFENDDADGCVCQKCWWKVDSFHNFYIQIEQIHRSPPQFYESIFVQSLNTHGEDVPSIKQEERTRFNVSQSESHASAEELQPNIIESESEIKTVATRSIAHNKKKKIILRKDVPAKVKLKEKKTFHECDTCGVRYLTAYKLQRHVKQIHASLEYKCTSLGCVESFPMQKLLDRHVKEKHTTMKCEHCHKDFRIKYLQRHIRTVHSLEFQTMCDLCGKVSNTKEAHNIHFISEHSEQKGVQCDICKTWYKNKIRIRMHFLYRHIQKPVVCIICGKFSPNKKALVVHKRIHRENYKERFKCPVCEKGFGDRTKLREHSYIHTGITDAYKCNHCDKTFRFGSALYTHRKKAHPVEENLRKTSNMY